ncbi:MAG: hypothetical protein IJJ83_04375 [Muribaculaceae bacterium]|nr:hypothetical protein [Muribaculaceae bacterium]
MTLNNKTGSKIVEEFIEVFQDALDKYDFQIPFIHPDSFFVGDIHKDAPCFNFPGNIVIRSDVIESIGFTKEQLWAMFAHEVGHIVFKTIEMEPGIEKEYKADDMAIELGLGWQMVSALETLSEQDNQQDMKCDMCKRIDRIKSILSPEEN